MLLFLRLFLLCCTLFSFSTLKANNIAVSNISLTGQNAASNYTLIKFDLSWENSWRISVGPSNWDAAWVFAKYRYNGGEWEHVTLSDDPNHHSVPAGAEFELSGTSSSAHGILLQRDADGSGNIDWDGIQVRWEYNNEIPDDAIIDVKVFAIEMVYIPQGTFVLGENESLAPSVSSLFEYGEDVYWLNTESEISVGATEGSLYYNSSEFGGDRLGPIPASFPKGYDAFYCMKYEISEAQWVSFFNCLTLEGKESRDVTSASGKDSDETVKRNTVAWFGGGNATTTAPDRAMSFLSAADLNAYLDWAALRPITELEFEKACKGGEFPEQSTYAWGSVEIHNMPYILSNVDTPNELITNLGVYIGNALYASTSTQIDGPVRSGIFAASSVNHNRAETGGSYYGVMELSGNLYERVVTVGSPEGRAYTGEMGDGRIDARFAEGDVDDWPRDFQGKGYAFRGGSWGDVKERLLVTDRALSVTTAVGDRSALAGGRGGISAP